MDIRFLFRKADQIVVDIPSVRLIARAFPGAHDGSSEDRLVFEVDGKGFAWTFMGRAEPKRPRKPNLSLLAVRCSIEQKEMLLDAASDRFFDDEHYRGYQAVLVRLGGVERDESRPLLQDAVALTKQLVKARGRRQRT